jgi:putative membrane protein
MSTDDERTTPGSQADDVTRRTYLASERTFLAWWRSGLAAVALAVGIGGVVPNLTGAGESLDIAFVGLGAGFGVLGVVVIAYGAVREREVSTALARGGYAPLPGRGAVTLAVLASILGVATTVVVVLSL